MSFVDELQSATARVVERVGPAVVRIGRGWGRGAGVVIGDDVVLTNAHNLRGEETTVTFADGRSATATVAGVDVDGDLAVLRVDTAGAAAVAWEPEQVDPVIGTPVFALANPGGRGLRVTFGTVSAVGRAFAGPRGRRISGSLEHTAPLGRGSSGGPVVDGDGRLLGINTNRLGDGFYLALPADRDLQARVDSLSRGESPTPVRLGIGLAPAHAARRLRRAVGLPERDGLLVRQVEEGGPAARAGIQVGDLIVEAGGRAVVTTDDLFDVLDGLDAGVSLPLKIVRGTDELDVSVSFGVVTTEGSA